MIHGKHPDKDPRMQVSNDFRIVTWNWVRISKALMENLDSSKIRINNARLNKLMRIIIVFNDFFADSLTF